MIALKELVNKIDFEINQNLDRHSHELIIQNLELILKYCHRYYDRQFYSRTILNKDLIAEFEQFIKNYISAEKLLETGIPTVQQCGDALNMSGHYLSDMLRAETGKSAKEHITTAVIDKAKIQ
ncbi:MAG: hypothetical protein AAF587_22380 [Bacteroidota bacterium]